MAFPQDDSGFEMHALLDSREFIQRELQNRTANREQLASQQIAQQISDTPETMLQILVAAAVEYCGADSSGVSVEEPNGERGLQSRWIVVAESFEK